MIFFFPSLNIFLVPTALLTAPGGQYFHSKLWTEVT